jgi:hypothetical protein
VDNAQVFDCLRTQANLARESFKLYWFWLLIHMRQILLLQNRVLVLTQWAWSYLTFKRSARIITGDEPPILVNDKSSSKTLATEARSSKETNVT